MLCYIILIQVKLTFIIQTMYFCINKNYTIFYIDSHHHSWWYCHVNIFAQKFTIYILRYALCSCLHQKYFVPYTCTYVLYLNSHWYWNSTGFQIIISIAVYTISCRRKQYYVIMHYIGCRSLYIHLQNY